MRVGGTYIALVLLVGAVTLLAPDATRTDLPQARSEVSPTIAASTYADELEHAPFGTMVMAPDTGNPQGTVSVTVTVINPVVVVPPRYITVYRFYCAKTGTHFYTASALERDIVNRTWPDVWADEGEAYRLDQSKNAQPLYRFWNRFKSAHFYTASALERDIVMTRWPGIFDYEGIAYNVSASSTQGNVAVYRFYNRKNGAHFYTASALERDIVFARWSNIYQYEGVAFWLGQ